MLTIDPIIARQAITFHRALCPSDDRQTFGIILARIRQARIYEARTVGAIEASVTFARVIAVRSQTDGQILARIRSTRIWTQ